MESQIFYSINYDQRHRAKQLASLEPGDTVMLEHSYLLERFAASASGKYVLYTQDFGFFLRRILLILRHADGGFLVRSNWDQFRWSQSVTSL